VHWEGIRACRRGLNSKEGVIVDIGKGILEGGVIGPCVYFGGM